MSKPTLPRSLTTQDVTWFLDLKDKDQLDLNPPYQRRSVWSPRDRRYFIDTILNNYPAPPIFLHKTLDDNGRATYHVVDGKQRLQTILAFRDGKIAIPQDFTETHLQNKKWKDLDRSARERFWNYVLIVEMLPDNQDSTIRNTFERINRNSRRLTSQEMRHAKYDGWFIKKVDAESGDLLWSKLGVVTKARSKRMTDNQFISELMMISLKRGISGFDQDELDELYAEYDDISEVDDFNEDEFNEAFSTAKERLAALAVVKPDIKMYTKSNSNLYTLWSLINLNPDLVAGAAEFAENYIRFMSQIDIAREDLEGYVKSSESPIKSFVIAYAEASKGATTELNQREERIKSLTQAIVILNNEAEDQ